MDLHRAHLNKAAVVAEMKFQIKRKINHQARTLKTHFSMLISYSRKTISLTLESAHPR